MKLKKACYYVFLFAIILLNLSIVIATNKKNNNIKNYFRIHIVSNSDSIDDQMLKLQVAKNIEKYINIITTNCNTKEESKLIITENINYILNICKTVINENNKDYNVKAYIGNIEYDLKSYNNLQFEPGIYDSLKIVIGNGNGTNWWSLIYPSNINLDDYSSADTSFSFKIVEIIKDVFCQKEEGKIPSFFFNYKY